MLKKLVNECKIKISITNTGPLLIKSGYATPFGSDMTPVMTHKDGKPQVFLPGSSLKGVFRSHLEKICRTINENSVCNPFNVYDTKNGAWDENRYQSVFCGSKFQKLKDTNKEFEKPYIYKNSCLACRLFGSTFFSGRCAINDAYLVNTDSVGNPIEQRDGVGIDRFTGGISTGPFNMDVIRAGMVFETDIYIRNFELWQLGGIMQVIDDLNDKLIRIGMGRSRGLGEVKGDIKSLWLGFPIPLVASMPDNEIWGMGKLNNDNLYGVYGQDIITIKESLPYRNKGIRKLLDLSLEAAETENEKSDININHNLYENIKEQLLEAFIKAATEKEPIADMQLRCIQK